MSYLSVIRRGVLISFSMISLLVSPLAQAQVVSAILCKCRSLC